MRTKLIRDRMEVSQGGYTRPANHVVGRQLALLLKLHEEAEEIGRDATSAEEYADLLEVILELARINQVPWAEIERAMMEKRERLGGFSLGRIWVVDEPVALRWPLTSSKEGALRLMNAEEEQS